MKTGFAIAALTLLACAAGPAAAQRTTNVLGVPLSPASMIGGTFKPGEEDFACVRHGQQLAIKPTTYEEMRNVVFSLRRDGIEHAILRCRQNDDAFVVDTKLVIDLAALQTVVADAGAVLFGGDREAIRRAVGDCWHNVRPGSDNLRWERAEAAIWINCTKSEAERGSPGSFRIVMRHANSHGVRSQAPWTISCQSLVTSAGKALGGDGQSTRFGGPCVQATIMCATPPRHDTISIVTTCQSPAPPVRAGIVSILQTATAHKGPQVKAFVDACLAAEAARRPRPEDKEIGKDGALVCTEGHRPGTVDLHGTRRR